MISRRGKPIVKLVPIEDSEEPRSVWGTVEEARAKYGPLDEEFEMPERFSSGMRPSPLEE